MFFASELIFPISNELCGKNTGSREMVFLEDGEGIE